MFSRKKSSMFENKMIDKNEVGEKKFLELDPNKIVTPAQSGSPRKISA